MKRFFKVKIPRSNEYTYEQSLAFISSLHSAGRKWSPFAFFSKKPSFSFSLNILAINQQIFFVIGIEDDLVEQMKNQLLAQYQNADLDEVNPPDEKDIVYYQLATARNNYLPIKTIDRFTDVDPLSSILSAISRSTDPQSFFWFQIVLTPATANWQQNVINLINRENDPEIAKGSRNQQELSLMQEKVKHNAYQCFLRIIARNNVDLELFYNSFNVFTQAGGNQLKKKKVGLFSNDKFVNSIFKHEPAGKGILLNTLEISTLWHLPTAQINIPNIVWGKKLVLDAPENLPVARESMSEEEKREITFLGKTSFKNSDRVFGIGKEDRLRHIYIIGKTGSGKSTLIANMAIDDIRKGRGTAILDPHGDLIDIILEYIPKSRINDVCYLNPVDQEYAYPLNMLEVHNEQQRELMVSGIISIFHKLYHYSWGPRLEHILRNVLLTLAEVNDSTLVDILRVLNEKDYREKLLRTIDDPYITRFWRDEYDKMSDKFKIEAIAPIMNKIGQFVSSPTIRKIIGWKHSKVNIPHIMDESKILLVDLSQGKMGEDNSALLGAMIITQIQIAAMNRAFKEESTRVPFYLYVDEFQNFATESFIKILSEARKYKLSLTLANQYIDQINDDILRAIFGNVGTLINFNLGARDAKIVAEEFGSLIEEGDLTSLDKYQIVLRESIDLTISQPFAGYSLPLPANTSHHREKIIAESRKRFGLKLKPSSRGGILPPPDTSRADHQLEE